MYRVYVCCVYVCMYVRMYVCVLDLCIPFFKKMVELDLVLLSHTGEEHSVSMACIHVIVCMCVCICMYVCMYVCMCVLHFDQVDGGFLDNKLGNPLKLRRALDLGVTGRYTYIHTCMHIHTHTYIYECYCIGIVIAAHCATEGHGRDDDGTRSEYFHMLMKMMDNPKYKKLLYAGKYVCLCLCM